MLGVCDPVFQYTTHTSSGTFLQTLPQVKLRQGSGTLYLRAAVQRRGQRPPKGSGTDKTVEAT